MLHDPFFLDYPPALEQTDPELKAAFNRLRELFEKRRAEGKASPLVILPKALLREEVAAYDEWFSPAHMSGENMERNVDHLLAFSPLRMKQHQRDALGSLQMFIDKMRTGKIIPTFVCHEETTHERFGIDIERNVIFNNVRFSPGIFDQMEARIKRQFSSVDEEELRKDYFYFRGKGQPHEKARKSIVSKKNTKVRKRVAQIVNTFEPHYKNGARE